MYDQCMEYTQCQNALVEFICKDLQPISIVDSPSFLQLLSTLDPRYIPASRTTFSRAVIPNKYASVKESILGSLSAATHCSLTTDLWTGCHRRAYMSVTVHYITSDWEMKHHCLQTREVEERHTAENLSVELQTILKEWGLECKAYGCTTDNASNITNAIENHMSLCVVVCVCMHASAYRCLCICNVCIVSLCMCMCMCVYIHVYECDHTNSLPSQTSHRSLNT